MKSRVFLFLIGVSSIGFSQTDSTVIKNQTLISDLRKRIETIENGSNSDVTLSKQIEQLKLNQQKLQDSIVALNGIIRKMYESPLIAKHASTSDNCVRLYYRPYETKIDYTGFKGLDSIAQLCTTNPNQKLKLVGYADKSGKESVNMELSQKRVVALKNYLVTAKKIPADHIILEWYGSALPLKNVSEQKKLNRRAEIFLIGEEVN